MLALLTASCIASGLTGDPPPAQPGEASRRPRVVVTTDGEVDDRSSFVRLLLYGTDFDIAAIVATNSIWQKDGHGTGWILELIDRYEEVRPNLLRHDPRFPDADSLRALVVVGNEDRSRLHSVGPGHDTPGSRRIVEVLLDDDPRPVWLQAWGGTNTIAQALWRLRESHPGDRARRALDKARIFAISDQDSTLWWIRDQLPETPLILSYQFTAINYQHEGHPYSDSDFFSRQWTTAHMKEGHGPLGAAYPQSYFSEGDSPAFFHVIGTGLRSTERPSWGGWGGRFTAADPARPRFFTDAADDGDPLKPLWRWLPAIQNDLAARMDWSVESPAGANHPPRPRLDGALDRTVPAGNVVRLSASPSTDPDGDSLDFRWWQYREPGTYGEAVAIRDADRPVASFVAPRVAEPVTIHVILEVTDRGEPALTRYRRVVVTVTPDRRTREH